MSLFVKPELLHFGAKQKGVSVFAFGKAIYIFLFLALYFPVTDFFSTSAQEAYAFIDLVPYPAKDSIVFNPYDPEDSSHALLKILQPFYGQYTERTFQTQDLPGRGGASAWIAIGMEGDNGYTLALTDLPNLAMLSLSANARYDIESLRNVCLIASMPLVLWVPKNSPLHDLEELFQAGRAQPEKLMVAGPGTGTIQHLSTLRLSRMGGMRAVYLPYSGDYSSMQAAFDGKAHAFWGHSSPELLKTCRPLAIAAQQRHPLLPNAPTFMELGYEFIEISHFGLAVSAKTKNSTVQNISATFLNIALNPDFQKQIELAGFTPTPVGAFELRAYLGSLITYYMALREEFEMR